MKILSSEITPYKTFLNRRKIIKLISYSSLGLLFSKSAKANHEENVDQYTNLLDKDDTLNNFEEITNYFRTILKSFRPVMAHYQSCTDDDELDGYDEDNDDDTKHKHAE